MKDFPPKKGFCGIIAETKGQHLGKIMRNWYNLCKYASNHNSTQEPWEVNFTDENSYQQNGYIYTLKYDPRYEIDNGDREGQFTVTFNGNPISVEYSFNDAGEAIEDYIYDDDIPETIETDSFEIAEKSLGYTNAIEEAGYITPEGNLVNLSEMPNQRTIDHRAIGGNTKGMQEYIAQGNIRIGLASGFMDIRQEPTPQQYQKIKHFVEHCNNDIQIDLQQGLGELREDIYLGSKNYRHFEFPSETNPQRVIGTIRQYFS